MINGVINVYKEKGYTSHDVVAKLRGILGQKKIGHTGTLDPDARGVLPVCLGRATKLCDMLTDKDKTYEAVLLFGKVTDTQDITGTVLEEHEISTLTEKVVKACIQEYIGAYEQLPPMYSALKVNGKKLYELAREGIEVERKKRHVQIYNIQIQSIELPRVCMKVTCSKGTYIRTLCHDIGQDLAVGACMEQLLRTKVSRFELKNSLKLSQIEEYKRAGTVMEIITPIDDMFSDFSRLTVAEEYAALAYNGNPLREEFIIPLKRKDPEPALYNDEKSGIEPKLYQDGEQIRMYNESGHFIGIYRYINSRKEFKLEKLFLNQEELRG